MVPLPAPLCMLFPSRPNVLVVVEKTSPLPRDMWSRQSRKSRSCRRVAPVRAFQTIVYDNGGELDTRKPAGGWQIINESSGQPHDWSWLWLPPASICFTKSEKLYHAGVHGTMRPY